VGGPANQAILVCGEIGPIVAFGGGAKPASLRAFFAGFLVPFVFSHGIVEGMSKAEASSEQASRSSEVAATATKIVANVEKVIIGKRPQLIQALVAYLCEGHILLEDVPGVAKTMLARALARSVGCVFKRIQCTPDLLPTDVTGVSIFNQKTTEFEFRPGPIFAQTVLADEINRATPRTQSALLEAMAERRVTADGQTYSLKAPFLVIATQNPIDHEGTFPLPEAQLDRFLVRLHLGYPNLEEESRMLERLQRGHPIDDLQPVVSAADFVASQQAVREVYVDPRVRRYILEIVEATRRHDDLQLGGSPRASIALFRTGQAHAALGGRNFVLPDDIKKMAHAVLTHRLILRPESRLRKVTADSVVHEILTEVAVPMIEKRDDAVDYFQ
jgi:MoxR-like ATPase